MPLTFFRVALAAAAFSAAVAAFSASEDTFARNKACPMSLEEALGMDFSELREACFPAAGEQDASVLDCGQIRVVAARTGAAEWPEGDVAAVAFRDWCGLSGDRDWPAGTRGGGLRASFSTVGKARFEDGGDRCSGRVMAKSEGSRVSFELAGRRWSGFVNEAGWLSARSESGAGAAYGPLFSVAMLDPACGMGVLELEAVRQ